MTAYTKTVTGGLSFIGGEQLYPDPNLFPSGSEFPFGGSIIFQLNRRLTAGLPMIGGFSGHVTAASRTFTAAFAPVGGLARRSSRILAGVLGFAGSVAGQKSAHVFAKTLLASLTAAGSLHSMVNPGFRAPGGGGFGVPMPDSHFQRYQPTLRRQKVKA